MNSYVPLFCKSNFSFLEGASHPDELIEEASLLGIRALALCDRDGVYGVVRAHVASRETGLKLILGSQITIDDQSPERSQILLLAESRQGYAHLCRLITRGRLRSPKGESRVRWNEILEFAPGLIALVGGRNSFVFNDSDPRWRLKQLADAFGDRLYFLLCRHRRAEEVSQEAILRGHAKTLDRPTVAAHEVLYHTPARRDLQDVLTCIRHRLPLTQIGSHIRPNTQHALLAPDAFHRLFSDDPRSVARTIEIAARCDFSLSEIRYRYPAEHLPDGTTSADWLRQLTFDGARQRYPDALPPECREQIEKELQLIQQLDYEGYFLTMWEIVRFCREQGILCQGRGSAANSIVCYCLGITAVDPVLMNLLFERFLSQERAEPPDIDLDIEHERREEVIQHVYQKYGRRHAAMAATIIRYRTRSAIRDIGKALSFSETSLDRLAKLFSYDEQLCQESFRNAGIDPDSKASQHLYRLVSEIQDFPRHLSIHPGGFLLGHEPVEDLVPIENATMEQRTVIQWDKNDLDDLGLFKVDLLGLGALTQLHRCFDLLKKHHARQLEMATIPIQDEPTFAMIRKGDTVGVFQIESRAQMAMLPRLKPRNHYDLVVEISIVRPGPIAGGMVHPYLRRRNCEEPITYPHPSLEPVLEKTLGIPLFQEQVMKLAMVAADYTPGEADQLRRDMAAWRRSGRIERHRERLITRMKGKGIAEELGERVFEQIRGFGEYGFPESHAASFALIAYATAWFKCHYHAVFSCALLNSLPMGFYSPATLVEDTKRHGVLVLPVDVRCSEWLCTLEPDEESRGGFALRMGLSFVKGLHLAQAERLLAHRNTRPFATLEDLVQRSQLREDTLLRLTEAGALEGFRSARREALWQVKGAFKNRDLDLFPNPSTSSEEPPQFRPLDEFERVQWDYRTSHHSSRGHPLSSLREELENKRILSSKKINELRDGTWARYAGMVICRQRPGTAGGVVFMTLEDEFGFVNVVIWQKVFERHRTLGKTCNFIGVSGRVQSQHGVVHLIAEKLWQPDVELKPDKSRSRDFH